MMSSFTIIACDLIKFGTHNRITSHSTVSLGGKLGHLKHLALKHKHLKHRLQYKHYILGGAPVFMHFMRMSFVNSCLLCVVLYQCVSPGVRCEGLLV